MGAKVDFDLGRLSERMLAIFIAATLDQTANLNERVSGTLRAALKAEMERRSPPGSATAVKLAFPDLNAAEIDAAARSLCARANELTEATNAHFKAAEEMRVASVFCVACGVALMQELKAITASTGAAN